MTHVIDSLDEAIKHEQAKWAKCEGDVWHLLGHWAGNGGTVQHGLQNSWALIEHGGFKQQRMWVSPAEIEI